jgi:DNA polymerase (family X)
MTNNKIEALLTQLSKLMSLHNMDASKVKSIASSAFQIDRLKIELANLSAEQLNNLSGLNSGTLKKVKEILITGKLQELEDIKAMTPMGVLQLLNIRGLGPKKCNTLWQEIGITNPQELIKACKENKLIQYKGFTADTQESILQACTFYLNSEGKLLYADAEELIHHVKKELENIFGLDIVFVTGAFARQDLIIDQLEFIINRPLEFIIEPLEAIANFTDIECNTEDVRFSYQNMVCVIYPCESDNLMEQLFFTIGPEEFIEKFTTHFPDIDYSITAQDTDKLIFEQAGIAYIPQYVRNANSNLEMFTDYKPIQLQDIKGIIHNHSTYSDGAHSLEQMALACQQIQKEYFVISDHSQYASYAGGLDYEKILAQHAEIDVLNKKHTPFKIFKSIECDILPNGDLDYTPEILETFDLIIASVHSVLTMSQKQAMDRLEKAIANPYTSILGHPTGRLLLSREGYPIDMYAIIDLCAKHNVVIELNANPRRLDIDWAYLEYVKQKNVLISINPDAHSMQGILDIKYGVLAAQKGNIEAHQNLSSFSLPAFELFVANQKLKRGTL